MDKDEEFEERRSATTEVTARLRSRGITITGADRPEDVVDLLSAVERFEAAVEAHGGDLMVDDLKSSRPDDRHVCSVTSLPNLRAPRAASQARRRDCSARSWGISTFALEPTADLREQPLPCRSTGAPDRRSADARQSRPRPATRGTCNPTGPGACSRGSETYSSRQ